MVVQQEQVQVGVLVWEKDDEVVLGLLSELDAGGGGARFLGMPAFGAS